MLRDRIVVGIADSSLSERLQMIEDLTLEKAKTLVRQREAVHKQQLILKGQIKIKLGHQATSDTMSCNDIRFS